MSWLGYPTFLSTFSALWVLVSSDIYKSVMWTTNNPLFSQSGALSPCFGEDLEMRVHLQSSLPIVCPFDFIIMKTLPSKPATGVLYENFWIVYDKPSFDNCDVNMTYDNDGDSNKKLLECNSPEALKSFTYSVDFKAKTHANSGIAFVGGRYYYFLATSDGTDGSLNNTRDGHCNDTQVRMKFKVYICRTDIVDEKCQNVSIGEFLCPSDLPEATTATTTATPPPATVVTEPQNTTVGSTPLPNTTTTTTISAPVSATNRMVEVTQSSSTPLSTTQEVGSSEPRQGKLESEDIRKELLRWKAAAVVLACLLLVLIIIFAVCVVKRHKKRPGRGFCFTDMNKVTPPPGTDVELPSPDGYGKEQLALDMKHSFNNENYSGDCEDGKASPVSSFKPNIIGITPTVDRPNKNALEQDNKQVKKPGTPHPRTNSEQTGDNGLTPSDIERGGKRQLENGNTVSSVNDDTAGADGEQTGIGITPNGIESGDKSLQHEDGERLSSAMAKTTGDDGKKRENGRVPDGKEKVEKRNRRNKHKDKQDRHSKEISDIIRIPDHLPPLKANGNVTLVNYSPNPEKRTLDLNGGFVREQEV